MNRTMLLGIAALAGLAAGFGVTAKPVNYKLPPETAELKPGPNLEVAKNNCTGCHSADYISTQPNGPKFRDDFWKAEVNKMINVYGAPIDQADVPKIVEYLVKAYGDQATSPAAAGGDGPNTTLSK